MLQPNSKEAIHRINAVRRRAVAVPRRPPTAGRCSICRASLQFVTSYSAVTRSTTVMDGLSSSLYACLTDRLFWIHEVGGIANVDHWLGPVAAEANEQEAIAPPTQQRNEGSL